MPLYESNLRTPEKGWKSNLALSLPPRIKKESKPLKRTPLRAVGKKKRLRIQTEGSETKVFDQIWRTREHKCEICAHFISEAFPYCFAHRLAKGQFPKHRLDERNIALVCSPKCHKAIDHQYQSLVVRFQFDKFLNS